METRLSDNVPHLLALRLLASLWADDEVSTGYSPRPTPLLTPANPVPGLALSCDADLIPSETGSISQRPNRMSGPPAR